MQAISAYYLRKDDVYSKMASNKALQRRPRSTRFIVHPMPFAAPLNAGVGRLRRASTDEHTAARRDRLGSPFSR